MPDPTGRISHLPQMHRGVSWKQPCRVATTANITIATALNAGDTIDGVTLAAGDRVLVKDQSTASQNGIYYAGVTPARDFDMDQDGTTSVTAEEVLGAWIYVIAGTANGGKAYRVTNTTTPILGTTALGFAEAATIGASEFITGESSEFTTSLGLWTNSGGTLSRDTTAAHLMVGLNASAKFVTTATSQYIEVPLSGTFESGKTYDAVLFLHVEETTGTAGAGVSMGLHGTDTASASAISTTPVQYLTNFTGILVRWTPSANRTGVSVRLTRSAAETLGTRTWHVGSARAISVSGPKALGLQLVPHPGSQFNRMQLTSPSVNEGMRLGVSDGNGSAVAPPEISLSQSGVSLKGPGAATGAAASSNLSIWGEGTPGDLSGVGGINIEVGDDYVGLSITEKDATTIQLYDDAGGSYDIELVDQGSFGWKTVGRDSFRLNDVNRGLASIVAAAAIANTETVVASYAAPADMMGVGTTFRIKAYGRLTSGATAGSSIFRCRIGTTTLTGNIPASLTIANAALVTDAPFVVDLLVTVRTAGGAGTVIGNVSTFGGITGAFTTTGNISATSATVAIDTTAAKNVEFTYISGNAGTTATFENATVEIAKT